MVSVFGWLGLLLMSNGKASIMAGSPWRSTAAHFMAAGKQKQREEETQVPISPSRACLQSPNLLQLGPTS
jgi:hypothetical protein